MIGAAAIAANPIAAQSTYRGSIVLKPNRSEFYTLTLTGAADATTDIVLPISSFQVRLRSGTPTYVSAVVPGVSQASAVLARTHGRIRIQYRAMYPDGTSDSFTFAEAILDTVRSDEGASNQSISLSGHIDALNQAPKTIALTDVSYWSLSNGLHTARAAWDPNIQPGDTVTCGRGSFVVREVVANVSTTSTTFQLTE